MFEFAVATLFNIYSCNSNISNWRPAKCVTMNSMFSGTRGMTDTNISDWTTTSLENMQNMFLDSSYNKPLNDWDVSLVKNMHSTFKNAKKFNQDLYSWVTSSV